MFHRAQPFLRAILVGGVIGGVVSAAAIGAAVPTAAAPVPQLAPLPALGRAEGFGAAASGGTGAAERVVTSLADDGPGTLRALATAAGPAVIRFAVSGAITLSRTINVTSDKTIDGRGADITLVRHGLMLHDIHNVIVEGLAFAHGQGETEDAVQISGGTHDVWIDHCDLASFPDGLVDITQQSTRVTVSWNRFTDHDKDMLINGADTSHQGLHAGEATVEVTVAHNLFDGTFQRHPLIRYAHVHAYNNVVRHWGGYGMQSQEGGQLLAQANVFAPGAVAKDAIRSQGQSIGLVRSEGDLLLDGAHVTERSPSLVFAPPPGYRADIRPATPQLAAEIDRLAGRRITAPWMIPRVTQPAPPPTTTTAPRRPAPAPSTTVPPTSETGTPHLLRTAALPAAGLAFVILLTMPLVARRRVERRRAR